MTTQTAQESNRSINLLIAKIGKTNLRLDREIQQCLLLIHAHVTQYGDHTGFDRLIANLGSGIRKNSVKAWVEQTTHCYWDMVEKKFAKDGNKAMMPIEQAKAIDWREADGPEKEYVSIDFEKAAKSFMARMDKEIKEKGSIDSKALAGFIAKIRAYADEHENLTESVKAKKAA